MSGRSWQWNVEDRIHSHAWRKDANKERKWKRKETELLGEEMNITRENNSKFRIIKMHTESILQLLGVVKSIMSIRLQIMKCSWHPLDVHLHKDSLSCIKKKGTIQPSRSSSFRFRKLKKQMYRSRFIRTDKLQSNAKKNYEKRNNSYHKTAISSLERLQPSDRESSISRKPHIRPQHPSGSLQSVFAARKNVTRPTLSSC